MTARPAIVLGIDVGTTGVRAAAFDQSGRLVAGAEEPCPHDAPLPGRAEASADAWWRAVCSVCRRIGERVPLARVEAVGVIGQAPTAVLVDGHGRPVRPAILWLDTRAADQARALDAALGPGRAAEIGGNRMHSYFLGPKLAWLSENDPSAMARAALILQSHAFVVLQLTGEAACDLSTAMLCAPLFDSASRAWSEEGARAVGLEMRLLPRIVRAHEVVGAVTRAAEAASGLRAGTPVVSGGGDFAASALGGGVIEEGEACLMLGTAGNLLVPMDAARFDTRLINSHHVGCDRWLALGGTLCGAALEWFRRVCAPDLSWEALEGEAAAVDPRSSAVIALPYLQGERTPIWDDGVRGAFFGLDLTDGRGHLYRAMLEGVALGFRDCLAVAEQRGVRIGEVIATNGAGRSALLRQILADALGVPVRWTGGAGGTLAGAALLAGMGTGTFADAGLARVWRGPDIRHEPDLREHVRLGSVSIRRAALYGAVRRSLPSAGHTSHTKQVLSDE